MADEKDEIPQEHIDFMLGLKDATQKLVGEKGMVAINGDSDNGIYCITLAVIPHPPSIVLAACAAMVTEALIRTLAAEHNFKLMPMPSQKM